MKILLQICLIYSVMCQSTFINSTIKRKNGVYLVSWWRILFKWEILWSSRVYTELSAVLFQYRPNAASKSGVQNEIFPTIVKSCSKYSEQIWFSRFLILLRRKYAVKIRLVATIIMGSSWLLIPKTVQFLYDKKTYSHFIDFVVPLSLLLKFVFDSVVCVKTWYYCWSQGLIF